MIKRITKLDVILSVLLLFVPLILIILNREIRTSISDYAYSKYNYVFVMLLTVAGMMFIFNGSSYKEKWYNIILGLSLIGVAITPHKDFSILHYIFASIFFIGSVFTMVWYSSQKQRWFKIIAGNIVLSALLIHFIFKSYTLFYAEWIGILPITIHFIGESIGKID